MRPCDLPPSAFPPMGSAPGGGGLHCVYLLYRRGPWCQVSENPHDLDLLVILVMALYKGGGGGLTFLPHQQ